MSARQENRNRARIIRDGNRADDERIQRESLRIVRAPRASVETPAPISRMQVRAWMRANAADYDYCATSLAEAANVALPLPDGAMDDETHWVWDEAHRATDI